MKHAWPILATLAALAIAASPLASSSHGTYLLGFTGESPCVEPSPPCAPAPVPSAFPLGSKFPPTAFMLCPGCPYDSGFIICEDGFGPGSPPVGLGGVCNVDCFGLGADCTVTNTSSDAYIIAWDPDFDGIDDLCSGPHVGSGTTGGHKGFFNVYVLGPGFTGTITSIDP